LSSGTALSRFTNNIIVIMKSVKKRKESGRRAVRRVSSSGRRGKRAPNAYAKFMKKHYHQIEAEHPSWKFAQVSKEVAKKWRSMSASAKRRYK